LNKKREDTRRSELDKILNAEEAAPPTQEKERSHRKEKVL